MSNYLDKGGLSRLWSKIQTNYVSKTNDQEVEGVKTFSQRPILPLNEVNLTFETINYCSVSISPQDKSGVSIYQEGSKLYLNGQATGYWTFDNMLSKTIPSGNIVFLVFEYEGANADFGIRLRNSSTLTHAGNQQYVKITAVDTIDRVQLYGSPNQNYNGIIINKIEVYDLTEMYGGNENVPASFSINDLNNLTLNNRQAASINDLRKYVNLASDQEINGIKDFKNGIAIGGLKVLKDSSDRIAFYFNNNPKVKIGHLDTLFANRITPDTSNTYDIGRSGVYWKDLYLSGVLSDGTNSIAIANIAKKGDIPTFKTINGQSLIGTGDITIENGASGDYLPLTGGTVTGDITVVANHDYGRLIFTNSNQEWGRFQQGNLGDEFALWSNVDFVIGDWGNDQAWIWCTPDTNTIALGVNNTLVVNGIDNNTTINGDIILNTNSNSNISIKNSAGDSKFGFNDEGNPCIVSPSRAIGVGTDELDGDYVTFTFPEESGTLATTDDIPAQRTYYNHYITFSAGTSGPTISLHIVSTRSSAYTMSLLGSTLYRSKTYAASGHYMSGGAVSCVRFLSTTQAAITYGNNNTTVSCTVADFADSFIAI